MLRIYCDNGGYLAKIGNLASRNLVEVVRYPYENKNKKITTEVAPFALASTRHLLASSGHIISSLRASDKFAQIREILRGKDKFLDACHLDSAYKSGCDAFFTTDKTDIVNNSYLLEPLLSLRIFFSGDWQSFADWAKSRGLVID